MKSWEEEKVNWFSRRFFRSKAIDPIEHAHELRSVLEPLGDAFLRAQKGKTAKVVVAVIAAKVSAATF